MESVPDQKALDDWIKTHTDNVIDINRKVGEEAPELTHEEMLEIAEERESIEQMPEVVAEDVVAAIAESEEKSEPVKREIRLPAAPAVSAKTASVKPSRFIQRKEIRRRKG